MKSKGKQGFSTSLVVKLKPYATTSLATSASPVDYGGFSREHVDAGIYSISRGAVA